MANSLIRCLQTVAFGCGIAYTQCYTHSAFVPAMARQSDAALGLWAQHLIGFHMASLINGALLSPIDKYGRPQNSLPRNAMSSRRRRKRRKIRRRRRLSIALSADGINAIQLRRRNKILSHLGAVALLSLPPFSPPLSHPYFSCSLWHSTDTFNQQSLS